MTTFLDNIISPVRREQRLLRPMSALRYPYQVSYHYDAPNYRGERFCVITKIGQISTCPARRLSTCDRINRAANFAPNATVTKLHKDGNRRHTSNCLTGSRRRSATPGLDKFLSSQKTNRGEILIRVSPHTAWCDGGMRDITPCVLHVTKGCPPFATQIHLDRSYSLTASRSPSGARPLPTASSPPSTSRRRGD
jgi:hypothetical protein